MSSVEEVLSVASSTDKVTVVDNSTSVVTMDVSNVVEERNSDDVNGDADVNSEVASLTYGVRTVQTQHGDYRTVDEENIVLLKITRSPVPTDECEFIWIQAKPFDDDDKVSAYF